MHSINGYVYCNQPLVTIAKGKKLRWVLVAYGTEGDFHSPQFTGQSLEVRRGKLGDGRVWNAGWRMEGPGVGRQAGVWKASRWVRNYAALTSPLNLPPTPC